MSTQDPWKYRRRFLLYSTGFCSITIWMCILGGVEKSIATTAITMAFTILGTCVSSYVFGAAWEDVAKGKWQTNVHKG